MTNRKAVAIFFAAAAVTSILVGAAQAQPASIYLDPAGRYTLSIPSSWTMKKGFYGYTFRMGSAELRLATSKPTDPQEALLDYASRTGREWKEVFSGEGKIAGQRSVFSIWSGPNPAGVKGIKKMTVVRAEGQTYAFLTTAEDRDWPVVQPSVEAIEQSFQLRGGAEAGETPRDLWDTLVGERRAAASASAPDLRDDLVTAPPAGPVQSPGASAGAESYYSDPKGRFRIGIPRGWTASEGGGGVSIWRGETYVTVVLLDGPPGPRLLATFSQQFAKQWQNFRQVRTGSSTLGGMPGEFGIFAGTNPRGVPAVLRIVTAGGSRGGFILTMSVPQNEWESLKTDLQQMEQSFSAGGGSGAGPGGADVW
ncbi:MAG: hypothetical protein LAQ69_02775 [Acidobacteriia bacterium]|nr:hypothetical protein [Terriglobia bacterium]